MNSSLCRVCSVSSGADACPLPFRPPFPLPASSYPRRNRETSKLHARKAESSYLPDSRVATAPPFARSSCEISHRFRNIFRSDSNDSRRERKREGTFGLETDLLEQIIAFCVFSFRTMPHLLDIEGRGVK